MVFHRSVLLSFVLIAAVTSLGGCAAPLPNPDLVIAPAPRLDNQGEYLSPYTQDGTVAAWVDKAINAKAGSAIGATVGAYAGQRLLGSVPLVGGLLGSMVGKEVGRSAAISASGGWDYIRETSDVSFDSPNDMAVYLYANYAKNEHFNEVVSATWGIYPKVQNVWSSSIRNAPCREIPGESQQ